MSRVIRIDGEAAFVPLTKGHEAIVDAADVPLIEGRNWSALVSPRRRAVYAYRVEVIDGRQTGILMHRLIVKAPPWMIVDHADCDGLNNRRRNIRLCTRSENTLNVGVRKDNRSGLKGVSFDKRIGRWKAEICFRGRRKFLGYFDRPEDAHAAYADACRILHGEYGRAS